MLTGTTVGWGDAPEPDRPLQIAAAIEPPRYERCPRVRPAGSLGRIAYPELIETSGLVASRRHHGVLWAHNDSGNAAVLFAVGADGAALARYVFPASVTATDWEDIGLVRGRDGRPDRLVLADIGDNARKRERVRFVFVDEPDPAQDTEDAVLLSTVDVVEARYPDGPHNAEALLVDPRSGDLLVVTKRKPGGAALYRLALPDALPSELQTFEAVGELPLTATFPGSTLITAGDANEQVAVIRGYSAVWLWPWEPGIERLDTLLTTRAPCPALVGIEAQGEAIALVGDDDYVTTTEGQHPPLLSFEVSPRLKHP
jgi:hypothetical protein